MDKDIIGQYYMTPAKESEASTFLECQNITACSCRKFEGIG